MKNQSRIKGQPLLSEKYPLFEWEPGDEIIGTNDGPDDVQEAYLDQNELFDKNNIENENNNQNDLFDENNIENKNNNNDEHENVLK